MEFILEYLLSPQGGLSGKDEQNENQFENIFWFHSYTAG